MCLSKPVAITDSSGNSSGWYKQPVSKVDSINDNKRIYPKAVYNDALDVIKSCGFPFAGEHPHPDSFLGNDGQVHFKTTVKNAAVVFRNAYIDQDNTVWAEYKTLDTIMGKQVQSLINSGIHIGFSNRMAGKTYRKLVDDREIDVATSLKIYSWDIVLNPAEKTTFTKPVPLTDCIKYTLTDLEENMTDTKIESTNVYEKLIDEVDKLPYSSKLKQSILKRGEKLTAEDDIAPFIKAEKDLIDQVVIHTKLNSLGYKSENSDSRAYTIYTNENIQQTSLIDNIMAEMDRELSKKDPNYRVDNALRKANQSILNDVLGQLERSNSSTYRHFMQSLKDEQDNISIKDGVAITPAMSGSGEFAQSASISLAILKQAFNDIKFLQLCLVEGFAGSTYKMPVEFQSSDIFNEDMFSVGEFDGVPTESIQTFMLEFGAEWLKRGFIVSKEAEKELLTGPLNYNLIASNAANIAGRFSRIIDAKISTEMIARSDEYQCVKVYNEIPNASEIIEVVEGVNCVSGTNAEFLVKLRCGKSSLTSPMPSVVRPRLNQWLDTQGRLQKGITNAIIVHNDDGDELIQGVWNSRKSKIVPFSGQTVAHYAVDFEDASIYFAQGVISPSEKPIIAEYSYATNIAYFNLSVPAEYRGFEARYYNKLLELVDRQQALMGSAPRYVMPDFLIGSMSAMVYFRQAELFYKHASPDGTSLLAGELYFGRRNGIDLAAHNSPWVAGDSRILLGKRNSTRVGIGSEFSLEGPFQHIDPITHKYTSAKEWISTQQIAVNTPLVIDKEANQYQAPYRTIKYYYS